MRKASLIFIPLVAAGLLGVTLSSPLRIVVSPEPDIAFAAGARVQVVSLTRAVEARGTVRLVASVRPAGLPCVLRLRHANGKSVAASARASKRVSFAVRLPGGWPAGRVALRLSCGRAGSVSATVTLQAANAAEQADVIFFDGPVLTMDPAQARAEAVAVRGDEIIAVGPKAAVLRLRGAHTRMIDLAGHALLPGFNDAHAHWIGNPGLAGLTQDESIATALRGGFTSVSELFVTADRLESLKALDAAGKLHLRVNAYLPVNSRGAYAEKYGIWFGEYKQGQVLGPRLRIGGAKLFVDGWLLSQPYSDRPGYYGTTWWTQDELNGIVKQLADSGWQIATHATGDGGIDMILTAYKAALASPENERRFRIEHLEVLRDDQIQTIKQYHILASIQLPWYTTDWLAEPSIEGVVGPDRVGWLARWRDLVDAGVKIVGSTDQPWSGCYGAPCSAIAAVALAATRTSGNGITPTPWMLAQRLTVEQGLEAMTTAGAYSTFEEKTKGTITPHKLADLVILDQDPLTVPPEQLRNDAVLATIVGGHSEYCAAGAAIYCP